MEISSLIAIYRKIFNNLRNEYFHAKRQKVASYATGIARLVNDVIGVCAGHDARRQSNRR
jgi:hypothetical protein